MLTGIRVARVVLRDDAGWGRVNKALDEMPQASRTTRHRGGFAMAGRSLGRDLDQVEEVARKISRRDGCDIFLYNGKIEPGSDLDFMYCVNKRKRHDACRLLLTTDGGDADAAYKIGRYLQKRYDSIQILISGKCKSAGTLIAIAADELIFSPYGEMGPLDVQVSKEDKLGGTYSVLNINEGLNSIERKVVDKYLELIARILHLGQNVVSFPAAAKAASELVTSLYGPILGRLDLAEIGGSARTTRIAVEYADRLNVRFGNLRANAIERLAGKYPSHTFVVDQADANELFNRVRHVDDLEYTLIGELGDLSRWQNLDAEPIMRCLSGSEEVDRHLVSSPAERGRTGGRQRSQKAGRNGQQTVQTRPRTSRSPTAPRQETMEAPQGPLLSTSDGGPSPDELLRQVFDKHRGN